MRLVGLGAEVTVNPWNQIIDHILTISAASRSSYSSHTTAEAFLVLVQALVQALMVNIWSMI